MGIRYNYMRKIVILDEEQGYGSEMVLLLIQDHLGT
jgi:hypothetical protein